MSNTTNYNDIANAHWIVIEWDADTGKEALSPEEQKASDVKTLVNSGKKLKNLVNKRFEIKYVLEAEVKQCIAGDAALSPYISLDNIVPPTAYYYGGQIASWPSNYTWYARVKGRMVNTGKTILTMELTGYGSYFVKSIV